MANFHNADHQAYADTMQAARKKYLQLLALWTMENESKQRWIIHQKMSAASEKQAAKDWLAAHKKVKR